MKKSKLKLKKKHFKKIKKNKNIKSYKFNICNLKIKNGSSGISSNGKEKISSRSNSRLGKRA